MRICERILGGNARKDWEEGGRGGKVGEKRGILRGTEERRGRKKKKEGGGPIERWGNLLINGINAAQPSQCSLSSDRLRWTLGQPYTENSGISATSNDGQWLHPLYCQGYGKGKYGDNMAKKI